MKRNILIVDDSAINRQMLRKILNADYEIYEAKDGEEALAMLGRMHERLSAVLLDIVMPVMDGHAVLERMQADPALAQLPVIVATGDTDSEAELTALTLGANDFITKPYNPNIIKRRVQNVIELRETAASVYTLQRDRLTGLYTREIFFQRAAEMIQAHDPGYYVIACFDIDNFKLINDQFGNEKGDDVLKRVASIFETGFGEIGGIACRISADNFALLYPTSYVDSAELTAIRESVSTLDGSMPPLSFSIGRYIVDDLSLSVAAMYDRAVLAEASIKGRFDYDVAVYDESMRERLLQEQEIVNEMRKALANHQFEVWLQPQYNHSTGALIGAEALVRWRHPTRGLIMPGVFIPVFERNGFVYELDKYVWEHTCIMLREWIDAGLSPLPVSVNVSRYDVFRDDLLETITQLIRKYDIPVGLLRLEITESAFAKSAERIISVVKSMIDYGFTVEIDDFGSGYSSLNTLKDVPAQIVKLDMRFLESHENSDRGGNILESIVRMTKWLGMAVIAEGVETVAQADYLKSIGCNYIQGYLYAKPMPREEYEALVKRIGKEEKLLTLETVENLDNNAFWNPESMDTLIFNTYVGGACIFEWHNERIEILRANEKYVTTIGGKGRTVEDALNLHWEDHMGPETAMATRDAIERTIRTGEEATYEAVYFDLFGSGKETWLRTTFRVIARAANRYLLYATNENITAQHEAEAERNRTAERLEAILANINGGVTAVEMAADGTRILFANEQFYSMLGYTRAQYEAEIADPFSPIHPEDRERVVREAQKAGYGAPLHIKYRDVRRDGTIIWVQSNISVTTLPGVSEPVQLSVHTDITAQVEAEQMARETAERIQIIMDNVGSGILAVALRGDAVEYLFVNDRYYALHGYTKAQYEAEVTNVYDLFHPDDRQRAYDVVQAVNKVGKSATLKYRVIRRDHSEAWIRTVITTRKLAGVDCPVQFSVLTDITAEKRVEEKLIATAEQLRFLNDTAGDLLAQADAISGIDTVLQKVLDYFGAKRAYIYEYNFEKWICANTYEIYPENVQPDRGHPRSFPMEECWYWLKTFETSDFFHYDDAEALGEDRWSERNTYTNSGITRILAVALRAGGKLLGTMGVDNPTRHLGDYADLKALGDYMAVILTRRNLTARIESDREYLQNMMNDTPGGFVRLRVHDDGKLTTDYVNEPYCRLCGYSLEDMLFTEGQDVALTIHPDDLDYVRSTLTNMFETGETSNIQYRLKHASGRYIPVNTFARATRNEAGDAYINVYYVDLSEQERKELSLRETMPYVLSAIMQYSTDLVFAKDKEYRYICCSPAFVKFTRQKSEQDVIGKNDYDFWTKEEADHFRGDDVRLIEGGEPLIDYIEPIPSDDGIQHYCRTSKYILRDSTGEIVGMYGIGRDITAERTAFEQLTLLTNSIPGGLATYELSPHGNRITYFNDGFCNMMGYTREEYEEISADSITNLTFAEDIPGLVAQIDALCADGTPLDCTYRIHSKDGGFKWVNSRASLAERRGDICIVNVVLFDVTETMLANEAVRIHEQELRLAISQLGRMVCEYDPRTRTLTVPESFASQYGLPAEVHDVPDSLIAAGTIDEATLPAYRAFYDAILRGEKTGSAEYCDVRADGSRHWERVEFSSIFDSDGRPVKAVIAVEDTTQQHLQYELERNRPTMGEENLLVHALFNITTGETLDYAYSDGSVVPEDERTAFHFGKDKLDGIIINDEEREQYRTLNDPEYLLACFERGETELSIDYRRRMPDGAVIWVRNLLHLLREPGGSDVLLFEYCYSIETEKTRELMYASLVNENFDYVARIRGASGRFKVVSNTMQRDDLIPQSGEDFNVVARDAVNMRVHPDDKEMTLDNILLAGIKRNLSNADRFQFTFRIVQPDGEIRYKRITQYYLDRERDIIIFTREDVTTLMQEEKRKNEQLEAALEAANEESRVRERETAAQLSAIMNNVDGGMSAATLVDGEIGYLYVNDAYYSMFGYTREQFQNELPRGLVDIIHPDDLQMVYDAADKSVESGTERMEFRVFKRDGSIVWIRSISSTCEIIGVDAPVHIAVLIDITKERDAADRLRISEEQFRIAASIGGRMTARYDIKNDVYYHDDDELLPLGFGYAVKNMPQAFVDAGIVMPECIPTLLAFYDKIRRGERHCTSDVAFSKTGGEFVWMRGDATVIFDSEGEPSQAIIVFSDITEQREKEAVYRKWQQSLQQRPRENYTLFRCNLSKNSSFDSVEGDLLRIEFSADPESFDGRTKEYANAAVYAGDRETYLAFLNSDTLLANYYRGVRTKTLEYREVQPDNTLRWLRLTAELVEYPNSSDIEAFLMFENIDESKRDELRNKERAETDSLTGVLNREAFSQAVEHMIGGPNASGSLALLMLDIDCFKSINDTFGHTVGDQVLIDVARTLRSALRHGDIIGRLGGDEFLVCLPDMSDHAAIERKAGQICSLLYRALNPDTYMSVSIGIALYPGDGKDFDTLYRKMDVALYAVKNNGKNNYAFFRESFDSDDGQLVKLLADRAGFTGLATRRRKRRILIVDDNTTSLQMLAGICKDAFVVETAKDGNEALTCLRRFRSDIAVVLLDLIMPDMDGFAVLEKMRGNAEMQSIPVIVVSGMDESEAGFKAIECGAAEYITKPVNPDLLRLRIQSVISRAENERLRAQNSVLFLHNAETAKYRAALESAKAAIVEYDPENGQFRYDPAVADIFGENVDDRALWELLKAEKIASAKDIKAIRKLAENAAQGGSVKVTLQTPSGARLYRVTVRERIDPGENANRLLLTFIDIDDDVSR